MAPSQQLTLINLSDDIHRLIIQQLKARAPLFAPRYGISPEYNVNEDYLGNLDKKSREFHGDWTDDNDACVMALANWSMTCQYFHELIVPSLYDTIILRARARSAQSIQCLSQSPHWNLVSKLVFAGVWDTTTDTNSSEDWMSDTDEQVNAIVTSEQREKIRLQMEPLTRILSNLPPNLDSLTLDFPQSWIVQGYGFSNLNGNNTYDNDNNDEICELETTDRYRAQLKTVLGAIATDANIASLATKSSFELRLLNIAPLETTAYSSERFKKFLNHVTRFEIGLGSYIDEIGYHMNTMFVSQYFGERLSDFFFNHLIKCTDLAILADETWPLGLAPGDYHISLPLPGTAEHLPKIERVRFAWCFIDPTMVDFLVSHLSSLRSITFFECHANGKDSTSEVNGAPMWGDLFTHLVTATDPSASLLTQVSVVNRPEKAIRYFPPEERSPVNNERKEVLEYIDRHRINGTVHGQDKWHKTPSGKAERRQKMLYHYSVVDEKDGMLWRDEQRNILRFVAETDHKEWLRLVDLMEENMERLGKERLLEYE